MNKNKGIIGIGLILAIVLGIVVVGGGAYYLGKSGNKQEMKNPENVIPNNEDENLPVVENKQAKCDSNSTPSITVLSPNGGEVFTLGQTMDIKWNSKCINSNSFVYLNIGIKDSQAVPELLYNMKVTNTGSYNFTIPSNYNISGHKSNKYDLAINYIYGNGEGVGDHSDNSFTINSGTYTYKNHGITFELPIGYVPHEEQAEGGPSILISLPNNNHLSYITDASFWEKWNIPQYKYIKDEKIGETTFKVYTTGGITIYYFKQGNVAYEYSGDKNFLNTFKFIGWN